MVKLGAMRVGQTIKKHIPIVNNSLKEITFALAITPSMPALQDSTVLMVSPTNKITLPPKGGTAKVEVVFAPKSRIPQFTEEVWLNICRSLGGGGGWGQMLPDVENTKNQKHPSYIFLLGADGICSNHSKAVCLPATLCGEWFMPGLGDQPGHRCHSLWSCGQEQLHNTQAAHAQHWRYWSQVVYVAMRLWKPQAQGSVLWVLPVTLLVGVVVVT